MQKKINTNNQHCIIIDSKSIRLPFAGVEIDYRFISAVKVVDFTSILLIGGCELEMLKPKLPKFTPNAIIEQLSYDGYSISVGCHPVSADALAALIASFLDRSSHKHESLVQKK